MNKENSYFCLTLDLEQDYGRLDEYQALWHTEELADFLATNEVKLTVFVTGKILEEKPEAVRTFRNGNICEFQLHSYAHLVGRKLSPSERMDDMRKAIIAYEKVFGKKPKGYRAPQGNIFEEEISLLKKEGFLYDSSVIPTWRPGLFNNVFANDSTFFHKNGLLEIPFSKLPFVCLPFSLSYFQLIGWPVSRFLMKFRSKNKPAVFGFHLHNLRGLPNIKKLKFGLRLFYLRNQNKGIDILKKFVEMEKNEGSVSLFMSELAEKETRAAI